MRRGDMPEAVGDTLCVPLLSEIAFKKKRPPLTLHLVRILPRVRDEVRQAMRNAQRDTHANDVFYRAGQNKREAMKL